MLSSIKQWIPWSARVLRLITAEPAVLYSRLMPSRIAVRNLGTNILIHVQRNPQANVNTMRFRFPVPYLKKVFKSAQ